jgi:hypothetical protein
MKVDDAPSKATVLQSTRELRGDGQQQRGTANLQRYQHYNSRRCKLVATLQLAMLQLAWLQLTTLQLATLQLTTPQLAMLQLAWLQVQNSTTTLLVSNTTLQ